MENAAANYPRIRSANVLAVKPQHRASRAWAIGCEGLVELRRNRIAVVRHAKWQEHGDAFDIRIESSDSGAALSGKLTRTRSVALLNAHMSTPRTGPPRRLRCSLDPVSHRISHPARPT